MPGSRTMGDESNSIIPCALELEFVPCLDHAPCNPGACKLQVHKDNAMSGSCPEPLRRDASDYSWCNEWVMHQQVSLTFPLETKSTSHPRTPDRTDFAGSFLPATGFTRLLTPVSVIFFTPCLAAVVMMFGFAISSRTHLTDAIVGVD